MKLKIYILLILSVISAIEGGIFYYREKKNELNVWILDIGQGDSALIQKGEIQVLIDGGPDKAVIDKLGKYMPFYDRTIELVVLTHPHDDHYGGLIDVFDLFKVEQYLYAEVRSESTNLDMFKHKVGDENSKQMSAAGNQSFKIGDYFLDVLYPYDGETFQDVSKDDLNNASVIMRLSNIKRSILFVGDAESKEESNLLKNNVYVKSDFLKVGHHGSKTSSTEGFLKAVLPSQGAISCGKKNKFKHPSKETLEMLDKFKVEVFRTDEEGDIKVI